jgi:hypothetical protein
MGFLTPWFLGGLALLAVPLLIHLTRRDRATPVPFPSLMFVRRVPQPTTARRRLRDLPLLLMRALALALLAAAFARPLLDRARSATAAGSPSATSVGARSNAITDTRSRGPPSTRPVPERRRHVTRRRWRWRRASWPPRRCRGARRC